MWGDLLFLLWLFFSYFSYLYYRTHFKIPQGVNAFDYNERINLIGKLMLDLRYLHAIDDHICQIMCFSIISYINSLFFVGPFRCVCLLFSRATFSPFVFLSCH